jgi:hypothetical protein
MERTCSVLAAIVLWQRKLFKGVTLADPQSGITITLTPQVIMWMVGGLVTGIVALAKLAKSAIDRKFAMLNASVQRLSVYEHNLARSIFALLTRLHPDKAPIIIESMNQQFADSIVPQAEKNGAAKWAVG